MKKFISLFLVFSILALLGNLLAKERKGAELYIHKKDGQYERAELIAVKKNSLLLKDIYSGADVSIDIKDVKVITIERESKASLGAGIGWLIGGGFGVLIASRKGMLRSGLIFGLAGVLLGGIAGGLVGTDKTFQFEGKSDSEIQEILKKLSKQARVRNSQ